MYSHILIATDGSELARKGLDHGLSLARALGSKVTVVTVSEPIPPLANADFGAVTLAADVERFRKVGEEAADRVLDSARKAAEQAGIPLETVYVAEMRPAQAIIETAKSRNCNLIVMASHGLGRFKRLFLGSQTIEVLTHSDVPVLVVR